MVKKKKDFDSHHSVYSCETELESRFLLKGTSRAGSTFFDSSARVEIYFLTCVCAHACVYFLADPGLNFFFLAPVGLLLFELLPLKTSQDRKSLLELLQI